MSKFIPKHKDDRSSQFSSGASMASEPEAESNTSNNEVQHDEKNQESSGNGLLTRCLEGLKRASTTVARPFTGPSPLHRRYWFWLGLGVSGSAIALGWGWYVLEKSVTDSTADALTFVRDDTITIKAADGTILQQIGPATRETLKYSEIPKPLVEAFIAIEDQRFQQHHGVDFQGIARAAINNLVARDVVEGGSTITQQLARIVYFDQERTVWRKLKEMRMAQKLEGDLSKEQIIERYLNLVYLGSGAYGVGDAAWVYFSKPAKDLTLPEIAMLAALPPAPTGYSPFVNPTVAKERRDIVLQRMQEKGFITKQQAEEAIATPLTPKRSNPKRLDRQAYYFTEYVQQELPKYVSKDVLAKKGLTIETTLNPTWQTAAEEAVKNTIENNGRWEGFKQAALVAIDPRNGQIKAMVGGKDFYDQQFNRVTQAQRQPGSTFKTIVYATAIAAGVSPHRGYLDAPFVVDGYEPKNYSEKFRGWLSIKDALTNSVNIVAVKALIDVGWNPVITIAKKMGIESTLQPTYSLALGASEVNLLELTSAYGTLATNGMHVKPHGIHRILDQHGKVIYDENFKGERALDEETSAIMTWMLRSVVTHGTGRSAQLDNRQVAGKTGTSDEARDLWFVGYIPQVVAGVWLGNDDNKPTWGASSTAAYTWHKFMEKAVEDMEVEKFPDRPNQLEGRKGTIKAEPIRPKRSYSKKAPDSDRNSDDTSDRSERRRSRRSYNNSDDNSDRNNERRSRRRYRSASSDDTPQESRRSRRRRYYNQSQSSSEQTTTRRSRRQRSEQSSVSGNSASSNSTPRRSSSRRSRQSSSQSASEAPRRSAPAPRVERKVEAAPVAAPPAPPAQRKAPESAAPAPAAPPPEPPAPRAGE